MSEITACEVIDIQLPLRRDFRWRGLLQPLGHWSIIRIASDDGHVGWGEATALGDWGGDRGRYFGETPTTVRHVVEDYLAPALIGADPFCIEARWSEFDGLIRGHTYAKAAVEIALYDICGKICGQPLYQLLRGRVRAGADVAHMIGLMTVPEAVEEAQGACADGVRALQVKARGLFAEDLQLIEALRDALPDTIFLRLDANQGYHNLGAKAAIAAVRALASAGCNAVEQPTASVDSMAAVRAAVDIPIVADESCWQPEDAIEVASRGAADVLSIYLAKSGGISRAKRVAAIADAASLPCDVNGSLESGIGNAANVHFACSTPAVTHPCIIPVSAPRGKAMTSIAGLYYSDDVIEHPFEFRNGKVYPPGGPGLGIVVDEEKIAAYRLSHG